MRRKKQHKSDPRSSPGGKDAGWVTIRLRGIECWLATVGGSYPTTIAVCVALIAGFGWLYEALQPDAPLPIEVRILEGSADEPGSDVAAFLPRYIRGLPMTIRTSKNSSGGMSFKHEAGLWPEYKINVVDSGDEMLLLLTVEGEDGARAFRIRPEWFDPFAIYIGGSERQMDTLIIVESATKEGVNVRLSQSRYSQAKHGRFSISYN